MQKEKRGISGITHPLDEPRNFRGDYLTPKPKDHGLNQLVQAPKEIVETGFQAILGALTIVLARALAIRDSVAQAEKDLVIYSSRLAKGKGNTEKLQKKIDKIKASIAHLKEGVLLSERILQIEEKYQNLLSDDKHLLELLAKTIGNEGIVIIENNFIIGQKTEVGIKQVTNEEISLSQQFTAKTDDSEQRKILLQKHISQLEKANLFALSKQLVYLAKIREITEINNNTDFKINSVPWDEAFLASVMGASGRTQSSVRGGYNLTLKEGKLLFSAGKDTNQIAHMDNVTMSVDLPRNIEAALSVAQGEVPFFKSNIFSNLIKKALGDYSLLPGKIDVGQTGSEIIKSYPALNTGQQIDNIDIVRTASREMRNMLEKIDDIYLDKNDDLFTQKQKLIDLGTVGALTIPRYQVIVDLMNQLDQTKSKVAEGLSNRIRFVPESSNNEELIEELDDQDKQDSADNVDQVDEDKDQKIDQKERDLIKTVFPQGIDQRIATLIHKHPEAYRDYFIKHFGEKEGERIAKVVEQAARSILNIDWDFSDDFDRVGLIQDLFSAGYDMDMTEEQAKKYIYNIQSNRSRLIRMYGLTQGNRIADQVKEFAKKVLGQDGN